MKLSLEKIATICHGELINNNASSNLTVSKVATDSRIDLSESLFVALVGEKFDAHNFLEVAVKQNAVALCVNKNFDTSNINIPVVKVSDTTKAYQDIANYHRNSFKNLLVIGITGSVGKTSCKEIIKQICIEKFGENSVLYTIGNTNNHIGVPQNLLRLTSQHQVAVIEMGTSSFGEIEILSACAEPNIAIINSIAPCHLEKLQNLAGVATEKSDIFKYTKNGGFALYPTHIPQEEIIQSKAEKYNLNIKRYGDYLFEYIDENLTSSSFYLCDNQNNREKVDWSLTGRHQMVNATCAAIVGEILGLNLTQIANALSRVKLIGMRMKTTTLDGVTYINDAYNANSASMLATLSTLKNCLIDKEKVLILGDMLELGEISIAEHKKVLEFALDNFPNSKIVAVGNLMNEASNNLPINENLILVENSKLAYPIVEKLLKENLYIFLKASRGTALELAIREEAR